MALTGIATSNDKLDAIAAMGQRFLDAWQKGRTSEFTARFTFSSLSQLFSTITPQRWALIEHLLDVGPSSMNELSRALEADLQLVEENVAALNDLGLVETQNARVCCAFDVISVRFDLPVKDRHKSRKVSDTS